MGFIERKSKQIDFKNINENTTNNFTNFFCVLQEYLLTITMCITLFLNLIIII